jgi:hypothetical protein
MSAEIKELVDSRWREYGLDATVTTLTAEMRQD